MTWKTYEPGEHEVSYGLPPRLLPQQTLEHAEQAMPTPNDGPVIQNLVIDDMRARLVVGIQRYGTGLQPHNGRDSLRDAYEEALDLCAYLRQAIYERDGR